MFTLALLSVFVTTCIAATSSSADVCFDETSLIQVFSNQLNRKTHVSTRKKQRAYVHDGNRQQGENLNNGKSKQNGDWDFNPEKHQRWKEIEAGQLSGDWDFEPHRNHQRWKDPGSQDGGSHNGICWVSLSKGRDCSSFTDADSHKELNSWPWQERVCKLQSKDFHSQDMCLWQGCVVQRDLRKGAKWHSETPQTLFSTGKAEYCFREHCGNSAFDLDWTNLYLAQQYCDQKFGEKWRHLQAGPAGLGWPGEQRGSGLWECAHNNYHCDWASCKTNFCDDSKWRKKFCGKYKCAAAPL